MPFCYSYPDKEYLLSVYEQTIFRPSLECSDDAFLSGCFLLWLSEVAARPEIKLDMLASLLAENRSLLQTGDTLVVNRLNLAWKDILTSPHEQRNPGLCLLVLKHIDNEYPGLTLRTLAQQLDLNGSYLSRVISRDLRCTFLDLLHCRRILAAVEALWMPRRELSLDDIACQLGYSSLHYFYCVFKNYTGLTPAKARELIRLLQ